MYRVVNNDIASGLYKGARVGIEAEKRIRKYLFDK